MLRDAVDQDKVDVLPGSRNPFLSLQAFFQIHLIPYDSADLNSNIYGA